MLLNSISNASTGQFLAGTSLLTVGLFAAALYGLPDLSTNDLPTPEEYARQHNLNYSPEVIAFLRENKNVRIAEKNSETTKKFCATHKDICESTTGLMEFGAFSGDNSSFFGKPRVVFILPPEGAAKIFTQEFFKKPIANINVTDKLVFSTILFHELGHAESLAKNDRKSLDNLSAVKKENYADRVGAKYLTYEFGKTGTSYLIALRALQSEDNVHDTMGTLLADKKSGDPGQQEAFETYADSCVEAFNKQQSAKDHVTINDLLVTNGQRLDGIYICLTTSAPPIDPTLSQRKEAFIQSYKYLFQPS